MITCPWCGTTYAQFQSKCANCGGSLPVPPGALRLPGLERVPMPPPPPRSVPRGYVWRILGADAGAIVAGILAFIGAVFALVGGALTAVLALVGLPFLGIGLGFLAIGAVLGLRHYQSARNVERVLREGLVTSGEIVSVAENYRVQVNGRYPWTVAYRFYLGGQWREGCVTTLSKPDLSQQQGRPVHVLFMPEDPDQNTISRTRTDTTACRRVSESLGWCATCDSREYVLHSFTWRSRWTLRTLRCLFPRKCC